MISAVVVHGDIPGYSYRLELFGVLAGGRPTSTKAIVVTFKTDEVASVVCTLNDLVGCLPDFVLVDDVSNEWLMPGNRVPDFMAWLFGLDEKKMKQWLDNDRKEGEWS